jgi:hypothetical protein
VRAPGIASHPQAELVGVWGRDQVKAETLAAPYCAQLLLEKPLALTVEAADRVVQAARPRRLSSLPAVLIRVGVHAWFATEVESHSCSPTHESASGN